MICPVCGECAKCLIGEGVLPAKSAVYRCGACGIDFLAGEHENNYWETPGQDAIYEDAAVKAERMRFFGKILDSVSKFCNDRELLDIGAGRGEFALAAAERQWKVSVLEPSVDATAGLDKAGVLEVFNCTLEEFTPRRLYDCVTLLDVLEHTRDPQAAIAKCASCLKPGGMLVVLTPDGGSVIRSSAVNAAKCVPALSGALKYQYYRPHFCYVSARGLRRLAAGNNLEIVRIDRAATPRRFLAAKLRHHYAKYPGNVVLRAAISVAYPFMALWFGNKLLAFARKTV